MAMILSRGFSPLDVWDIPLDSIVLPETIGLRTKDRIFRELGFTDDFNRTGVDANVWTSGGDAGSFDSFALALGPTVWALVTGAVINQDRYINGWGVTENKSFSPYEDECTTVTWEARLYLHSIVSVSALWGLFQIAIVDYAEPASGCAEFFADPVVGANFMARSWGAAEEQTDTLVPLDTDFHKFRIVWTAASVLFYIDDVLVATHAAQIPQAYMHTNMLVRTEAAAVNRMYLDSIDVEVS